ncbi:saccharopine dehydrogenase-like oxidoreductase [Glomus cerebriforme]|uniref:Saccharopine dehydrogenase-like oxidoreductase n=1 Tax=Glomus cerebriforme TaxID=658196 RepID=A0A397TJI9_9GLOM|nr:saccharopine dehydrogenase-like oxidoreductase [Glomus cerebriforme]
MTKDLDIVVFGATGFTGRFVVEEICRTANSLHKLKWAISGRSEQLLLEVANIISISSSNNVRQPEVIVADVSNPESLHTLAKRAKVFIDCVGPFRLYGEPVVRVCIENETDYIDISGEVEYIEQIQLTYNDPAKSNNVSIVPACGYDSIPADMGLLFTKQQLDAKSAIPSQIEMFSGFCTGSAGMCANYGTYASLVYSISNINSLRELRKHANRPIVPRVGSKLELLPSRTFDKRVNGYIIPSITTDHSILKLGQQLDIMFNTGVLPAQISSYLVFSRFRYLAMMMFSGSIFKFLAKYEWGRNLLLKYPKFFSFGFFTKDGPTLEQIKQCSFYHRFYAKGISKNRLTTEDTNLINSTEQIKPLSILPHLQPDVEIVTEVKGPDAGYATTPITVVQCAYTLLTEKSNIPKGVCTPSVAFGKTSLLQRLKDNGIEFNVIGDHFY